MTSDPNHGLTKHLWLLLSNLLAVLIIGLGFAAYVWITNVERGREGRIHNCVAINELSRKVYVTMLDLGFAEFEVRKFLPTTHCERLP